MPRAPVPGAVPADPPPLRPCRAHTGVAVARVLPDQHYLPAIDRVPILTNLVAALLAAAPVAQAAESAARAEAKGLMVPLVLLHGASVAGTSRPPSPSSSLLFPHERTKQGAEGPW